MLRTPASVWSAGQGVIVMLPPRLSLGHCLAVQVLKTGRKRSGQKEGDGQKHITQRHLLAFSNSGRSLLEQKGQRNRVRRRAP